MKKISFISLSVFLFIQPTSIFAYYSDDSLYIQTNIVNDIKEDSNLFEVNSEFFTTVNKVTYIKLRPVAELYGYNLIWNSENNSITLNNHKNIINMQIDSAVVTLNGAKVKNDENTILINSNTYIPYELYRKVFNEELEKLNNDVYTKVSKELLDDMNSLYNEQLKLNEEYKKAYLETGGDEESYTNPTVDVGFNFMSSDEILSINVFRNQTLASAYFKNNYFNYATDTLELITLDDIYGENYNEYVKKMIYDQINYNQEVMGIEYFDNALENITFNEESPFYYTDDLVIPFNKYEITIGANGEQHFIIDDINEHTKLYYSTEQKKRFINERFEKFINYIEGYDFENEYNLIGYTSEYVLDLFGAPESSFVKNTNIDEDVESVYVYRASFEDPTGVYVYIKNNEVYKVYLDEFSGVSPF